MEDKKPQLESLADKVLERIEEERITPASRSRFVAWNLLFWGLWALSVVIGALAVAASIFVIMNAGWRYYAATHENTLTFFVESIPYLWILALLLFVFVAYKNIRHTKTGYRYSLFIVLVASFFGSLALGAGLYHVGVGEVIDDDFGRRIPGHRPVLVQQERAWSSPERGLLVGEVEEIDTEAGTFELETLDGTYWLVSSEDLLRRDYQALEEEERIRVVGLPAEEGEVFHACFVLPWDVKGMRPDTRMHPVARERLARHLCEEECERNLPEERSTECRDLRPYETLKSLRDR